LLNRFQILMRLVEAEKFDLYAHIIKASVLRAALSCIWLIASAQKVANAKNWKVVSFNLCADQLALEFGNRDQVLSLSSMAHNPALSYYWKLATGAPAIRASAEAALQMAPEIVFTGQYDAKYTKAVLAKAGMKTY
jgi:iron complex transport system substrate-binding protein